MSLNLGKRFFEQYPWYRFEPQPDTVAWADDVTPAVAKTVPLAAGIGRELRIVYAPLPHPVRLKQLDPNASYAVTAFDPVTGQQTPLAAIRTDNRGNWRSPLPRGDHDWVCVLQRRSQEK